MASEDEPTRSEPGWGSARADAPPPTLAPGRYRIRAWTLGESEDPVRTERELTLDERSSSGRNPVFAVREDPDMLIKVAARPEDGPSLLREAVVRAALPLPLIGTSVPSLAELALTDRMLPALVMNDLRVDWTGGLGAELAENDPLEAMLSAALFLRAAHTQRFVVGDLKPEHVIPMGGWLHAFCDLGGFAPMDVVCDPLGIFGARERTFRFAHPRIDAEAPRAAHDLHAFGIAFEGVDDPALGSLARSCRAGGGGPPTAAALVRRLLTLAHERGAPAASLSLWAEPGSLASVTGHLVCVGGGLIAGLGSAIAPLIQSLDTTSPSPTRALALTLCHVDAHRRATLDAADVRETCAELLELGRRNALGLPGVVADDLMAAILGHGRPWVREACRALALETPNLAMASGLIGLSFLLSLRRDPSDPRDALPALCRWAARVACVGEPRTHASTRLSAWGLEAMRLTKPLLDLANGNVHPKVRPQLLADVERVLFTFPILFAIADPVAAMLVEQTLVERTPQALGDTERAVLSALRGEAVRAEASARGEELRILRDAYRR